MITPLRRKFIDDMRLLGFAPTTQKVYVQAVQALAKYYHLSPEFLSDEQIRQFFLHQIDTGLSEGTFRTRRFAIQILFTETLNRPMPCLDKIRPRQIRKIPQILSVEEVFAIISKVRSLPAKACLWTTYCCGLRRSEAINLQVRDIDSARNVVLVRQGKGARDRQVPMSPQLLEMLRQYWVKERPQVWLFPNRKGDAPIPAKTLDRIFRLALIESGIKKQASLHTLRHSYATHLLESGVNLRIIQEVLGHSSPRTTAIYTHVTQKSCQQLLRALAEMAIPSLKIN